MRSVLRRSLPVLLPFLVVTLARADETTHEFVPDLDANEGTMLVAQGGNAPEAIVYRGEVLTAPEPEALQPGETPMRADSGNGQELEEPGRRSPTFHPDRVTELNGTVGYYTVFTPTIAPFKRVTALDTVTVSRDGTPILAIAPSSERPVGVTGVHAPPPDDRERDRFWGSVVLDFSEGGTVPFPMVSPESRVLTLETTPPVELSLSRDGADNLFATVEFPAPRSVRVVFLSDAPRSYFGRAIPDGPVTANARFVDDLPPSVQRDAELFAAELGLSRRSSFVEALNTLTRHFRSFEESSEPPRNTGNIYLDLARGMRGICRHRAYGFAITAQALGMRARFVQNEAHAWVEVQLVGDAGWLRVDLGGAATGLEARGAENRPSYLPETPDTLPRPEAYRRAYAEAARMSGLRRPSDGPGANPGRAGDDGASAGAGGDGPNTDDSDGPDRDGPGREGPPGADGASRGGDLASANAPDRPAGRRPTAVSVDRRQFDVFRGRELEVTGSVRGGGAAIEGLRVEALLRAPRGEAEWLLGVTVSREDGRFRGVFGVPPDLPVGDYQLMVRTPGNAEWAPATAR